MGHELTNGGRGAGLSAGMARGGSGGGNEFPALREPVLESGLPAMDGPPLSPRQAIAKTLAAGLIDRLGTEYVTLNLTLRTRPSDPEKDAIRQAIREKVLRTFWAPRTRGRT